MNPQRFGSAAHVLLIEHDNLVRSTVASVCRDMELVQIIQAVSLAQGEQYLYARPLQGLIISLAEGDAALEMLERLRAGAFPSKAAIPVVVMASACTKEQALRLKALEVRRLLLQPFRLRDVLHTVEQVWSLAEPGVEQPAPRDTAVS
jgi:DNA-binding NarL/FixJ family response regulator